MEKLQIRKRLKRFTKKEIKIFKVIYPEDITDDGLYSIGDGNSILDIEVSGYSDKEDFFDKLDSFVDIIFTDSSIWGWSKLLKTE